MRPNLFSSVLRPAPIVALVLASCAEPQEYQAPAPPPPPPPAPSSAPAPLPEPYTTGAPSSASTPPGAGAVTEQTIPSAPLPAAPPATPPQPADSSQLVYTYPSGQWVYTVDHGWIWVPAGATTVEMEGVPYVYLYTVGFGWTWYVSPWGWGPYRYGPWIRHPWHPVGWHGYWVAHPRVTVRLGRGRR